MHEDLGLLERVLARPHEEDADLFIRLGGKSEESELQLGQLELLEQSFPPMFQDVTRCVAGLFG